MKNNEGLPVGTTHENPILDTRNYIVEFLDGREEALQGNLITEYLFSDINKEGHRQLLLYKMIHHRNTPSKMLQYADSFTTLKMTNKSVKLPLLGGIF